MRVAFYVSGHGYGHAVRSAVAARALQPEHELHFVTPVPGEFLARTLRGPFEHRPERLDVGMVQPDGITIDVPATLRALEALERAEPELIAREERWLREAGIGRVLVDIPSAACRAARRAGLPCAVVSNFTWDDIYAGAAHVAAGFVPHARRMADQYATCDLLLRLPFSTAMEAFPAERPMGLVARRAGVPRSRARAALGLGDGPHALLSYGRMGLSEWHGIDWSLPPEWRLVQLVDRHEEHHEGRRCQPLRYERLEAAGLGYPDLVAAMDAVVTKPGYGIVSECIANRARVVYTDRGPFAEYPALVEGLRRNLPCAYVSSGDLRAGRLAEPLRRVMEAPWPAHPLEPLDDAGIRAALADFLS